MASHPPLVSDIDHPTAQCPQPGAFEKSERHPTGHRVIGDCATLLSHSGLTQDDTWTCAGAWLQLRACSQTCAKNASCHHSDQGAPMSSKWVPASRAACSLLRLPVCQPKKKKKKKRCQTRPTKACPHVY